jgi:DNA primase
MAFYNDDLIQQLKAHADIALIIERFVPLKKSGVGRFIGKCPFHDDRSPSMNVNPQLGIYKCFACGAGGDVFKFVMEHEKLDFKAAVEWVAQESGFSLPVLGEPEKAEITEEKEFVRHLNELAATWFENQLSLNAPALEYLAKRGITEETRQEFRIGYAPENPSDFISLAAKEGFSPRQVVKAGLAIEKENGGITDKFRGRLMIPIHNLSGTVVAFGGRIMKDIPRAPKYMNSPETILYSKSDILFGLNHAKNFIAKEDAVILVEGYFDLISLYQAGIKNVAAVSGTALTEMHAKILGRYAKTAFLVFDGDTAGKKATMRSLEILLPHNIAPRIFSLSRPNGEKIDPDNFVRENGASAFLNEIKQALDWLHYLSIEKETQSPEEKAVFVNHAKSLIAAIQDVELKEQYLNLLSERFNTSRSLSHVRPVAVKKKAVEELPAIDNTPQVPWNIFSGVELRFVNLILRNNDLWKPASRFFSLDFIAQNLPLLESSLLEELLGDGLALYAEHQTIDLKILHSIANPPLPEILEGLPEEIWSPANAQKEFLETLLILFKRQCDRFCNELKQKENEESTMLRLEINAFSKKQQKLLRESNLGHINSSDLFHQILENRTLLLEFHHKIQEG